MVKFRFDAFLADNFLSIKKLSEKTGIPQGQLYLLKKRQTIKPETLGIIVSFYPNAINYKK